MIRSADAFGGDAVVLTGSCVDPCDPKVVRSSAGSSFHLPVVEAEWEQVVGWAREHRVSLLALDLDAEHVVGKAGLPRRAGLVVGNEAHGLPERVLQDAAFRVRIPMFGRAESLNAASAATIVLYVAATSDR